MLFLLFFCCVGWGLFVCFRDVLGFFFHCFVFVGFVLFSVFDLFLLLFVLLVFLGVVVRVLLFFCLVGLIFWGVFF